MIVHAKVVVLGLFFGATLYAVGFADYAGLHRMFLFTDLRLLFTFAGAVALAMIGLRLFSRSPRRHLAVHRSAITGGALFGAGWALSGACPAIVLVQIASGQLAGVLALAGMIAGAFVCARLRARFPWNGDACGE